MKRAILTTLGGVAGSLLLISLYSRIDSPWCWFGWVALVPWLAALDEARSWRGALVRALVMNLAFVTILFGWFADTIQIYTGVSRAMAFLAIVLLAPILEPQFFIFAAVRHLARNLAAHRAGSTATRFWYVTVTAACSYVAAEWALPKLFTVTFGYGLYGSRLMRQAADITGSAGLTFVILIVNECVLASWRTLAQSQPLALRLRQALPSALAVIVLPLALLGYGVLRCRQIDDLAAHATTVKVAAVQANISNYEQIAKQLGTFDGVRYILEAHYRLSSQAITDSNPDLIVWPETVYPTTFGTPKSADGAAFDQEIAHFVAASGRPFIFGSYDAEAGKQYNAAVFLAADAGGKIGFDMYRKALLFPFTERVPALFDTPLVRKLFPWMGTWTPGPPPEPVAVTLADGRKVHVAPMICYDALDPDLALTSARKGADMIVTLSNDSWFAAGIAPRLHLIMAAFRSIETHLSQVRSTNTGISAAITATGDITDTLAVGETGVLIAPVALTADAGTIMLRWGNWLPPTALVGCGLLLFVPWLAGVPQKRPSR